MIEVTNSQSVKISNWGCKSLVAQSSLIGYFVPDAQRGAKIPFFLRGNAAYALRRNVADRTILQKPEAALACSEAREKLHPQQEMKFFARMKKTRELDVLQKFRFCKRS